ncbi:MAG: tetratricopeptide repeat protein [Gammaproteobacteria bacterium]|nr:tetratricopeptide repeat protein [Gammaproteobacteria bacterium]MBT8110969.1 tetratricopeptide repeat protein [Gammaproteobacteria bacterium]NND48132.1 tetratricopeptide repeat protein [Woeseiaceae bacterium]NNL45667.1 tetratricopeptide repeat protein [Woeseiaceae bacterium]
MNASQCHRNALIARYSAILLVSTVVISGCATTQSSSAPARIEIQQEIGFTITEETRINGDVRLDYDEALTYLNQGQLEQGVTLLEAVVEAAPQLSAPRIDLGIAYHRNGDLEAAERTLLQALESNPNHPIAHNELGIVYRETGRFAAARQSYQAALATYPGYHFARRNLAILCDLYLADLDCALQNYEAYMATVPSDKEATMWMADIRQRMGLSE